MSLIFGDVDDIAGAFSEQTGIGFHRFMVWTKAGGGITIHKANFLFGTRVFMAGSGGG